MHQLTEKILTIRTPKLPASKKHYAYVDDKQKDLEIYEKHPKKFLKHKSNRKKKQSNQQMKMTNSYSKDHATVGYI